MGVPGFPEAVVALLAHGAGASAASGKPVDSVSPAAGEAANFSEASSQLAADLLTEVCWVLAYLTAGAEAHLNRMVALGVVPPLVAHLIWCTQQVNGGGHDRARALLTPVLRSVGNIAAGGGSHAIQQLLTTAEGDGSSPSHGLVLPDAQHQKVSAPKCMSWLLWKHACHQDACSQRTDGRSLQT